jgi:hypothetical protein
MAQKKVKLTKIKDCMLFALENIIRYGDTDIFPYPVERQFFRDKKSDSVKLLEEIYGRFFDFISEMPVEHEKLLGAVGYAGFRQGTQIDPIWNAYLLGIVLHIGQEIEAARIPKAKNIIFSYRFCPDESDFRIFDRDYGWLSFQHRSVELAKASSFVLTCDISDFYPRVYHHRLENALTRATAKSEIIKQIKYILNGLSKGASYGLPVGGASGKTLERVVAQPY